MNITEEIQSLNDFDELGINKNISIVKLPFSVILVENGRQLLEINLPEPKDDLSNSGIGTLFQRLK